MANNSTPAANNKAEVKSKSALIPPEEAFWKKYSPHHEFPLSSFSSICIYILAGLGMWWVVATAMRQNDENRSLPVEEIVIAGGGGSPDGDGDKGAGDLPPSKGKEAVADPKPDTPAAPIPDPKLAEAIPDPLSLPELQLADARVIDETAQQAVDRLKQVSVEARKQLFQGLGPSKGKGGSGEGGGKGKGKGKGEGDLEGYGKGKLNARQKRILRWVMMFNTQNGEDYLLQLRKLGAILAIPDPTGGYKVIRDLKKIPAQGEKENLEAIQRIFWIDDKPQSVASLSQALRLPGPPPHVVAFFPMELEKKLLEKELKYHNRREEEIKETRFRIEWRGNTYEPFVDSQH